MSSRVPKPKASWRERLSATLFGHPNVDTEGAAAPSPSSSSAMPVEPEQDGSHKERVDEVVESTSMLCEPSLVTPQAEASSSSRTRAKPVCIQPSSLDSVAVTPSSELYDDYDGDDGGSNSSTSSSMKRKDQKASLKENERSLSSSPSSSSRRKNLAALLSTSIDDFVSNLNSTPKKGVGGKGAGGGGAGTGTGSTSTVPTSSVSLERIPSRPVFQQHSRSNSNTSTGASAAIATAGDGVEGRRSPSIGHTLSQGVKSLQERHKLNREAIETFKTMKLDEGSDGLAVGKERKSIGEVEESSSSSGQLAAPVAETASRAAAVAALDSTGIPEQVLRGEAMLKVTPKKVMQRVFRLDSDRGQILWESKKNNKVNLESIRELRTGASASSYRMSMSIAASHESRWISIIYQTGGVYKALHLIALSDEAFTRWKQTLSAVQDERKMLMSGVDMLDQRQHLWLRQHWKSADSSQDSRLDFSEVVKLCQRLGILCNGKDLRNRFREADAKGKGFLNFEDFQHFVTLLKRRVDVEALFLRWADVGVQKGVLEGGDYWSEQGLEAVRNRLHKAVSQASISQDRFITFLQTKQGFATPTLVGVQETARKYGEEESGLIKYRGFLSFLSSSENGLLSDQYSQSSKAPVEAAKKTREAAQTTEELIAVSSLDKQRQDMTRPLSEYFISSSHNTYLVGGQWKGDSTVEGYVRALLQGARSVEIDCWNGPGNEPQVTHGRTLTSKVPFRDVISAIQRYAFIASPFPVILSLEVHNDLAQQDVLAAILKETLGSKLLSEPLAGRGSTRGDSLPSPSDLQGKVLVKAKNLYVVDAAATLQNQQGGPGSEQPTGAVMVEKRAMSSTDTTESESDSILNSARGLVRSVTRRKEERRTEGTEGRGQQGGKKVLMSPLLASLLVYTIGVKHRGINKKEHYEVEHMISLSEKNGIKYLKSEINCEDLIKHNRTHLTRVYPSMSSFKRLSQSANFLPSLFWCMGCQLVAINWQTLDVGFEMNQAMFARNARCGYVLKPEALRIKDGSKPSGPSSYPPRHTVDVLLSVCIISAQQLPRFRDASLDKEMDNDDVLDPFVSLCVVVPQHRDYDVRPSKARKGRTNRPRQGLQSLVCDLIDCGDRLDVEEQGQEKEKDAKERTIPRVNEPSVGPSLSNRWMSRQRTSIFPSNGFNPIWNETLSFTIRLSVGGGGGGGGGGGSDSSAAAEVVQSATRGLLGLCFLRFEVGEQYVKGTAAANSDGGGESASVTNVSLPPLNASNSAGKPDPSGTTTTAIGSSRSSEEGSNEATSDESSNSVSDLESVGEDAKCLATHMISLGSLQQGYRHVPLYDAQLSQYLFSTLFVKTEMRIVAKR